MRDDDRKDAPDLREEGEALTCTERKRWLFFGLPFTFTTYTLTDRKLVLKTGLLTTTEDDILLYRVRDTSLRRTIWQKLFGLGSILVASSDQSRPELVIHNIRGVREFKELLDERVEEERVRMRFRTGEYIGVESGDDDLLEQL